MYSRARMLSKSWHLVGEMTSFQWSMSLTIWSIPRWLGSNLVYLFLYSSTRLENSKLSHLQRISSIKKQSIWFPCFRTLMISSSKKSQTTRDSSLCFEKCSWTKTTCPIGFLTGVSGRAKPLQKSTEMRIIVQSLVVIWEAKMMLQALVL